MAARRSSGKVTTNHEEIRRWVESKGGCPARVKGTGRGNDPGILRIDYPGFSGVETLERMAWDKWFDAFDKNNLAMVYQQTSRFSKLVSRESAQAKAGTRATPRRATGAKRATAKRGTAKRGAKKTTERRATTATAGRGTTKRATTAKRPASTAKRPATRAKRPATRATTTKRGTTKRTTAKRGTTKRGRASR